MKRHAIAGLLLWAIVFALADDLAGQLTRQIGNPGMSSPGTATTPIGRASAIGDYDYNLQSTIYLASELNIPAGSEITGLRFHKTNDGASVAPEHTLNVYLRETTADYYSTGAIWSDVLNGATQVAGSTTFQMPATAGWVSFGAFHVSTYTYQGGNLEVIVEWDCSATVGDPVTDGFAWSHEPFAGSTTVSRGIGYLSTAPYNMSTMLGTPTNFGYLRLPILQLDFEPSGGSYLQGRPAGGLRVRPGKEVVVGAFEVLADSPQNLDELYVEHLGTLETGMVTVVRLRLDVNGNGLIDSNDSQLGAAATIDISGVATFAGPALHFFAPGTPTRFLLTYQVSSSAAEGSTFGARILTPPVFSPDPDLSTYPVSWPLHTLFKYHSQLPLHINFEDDVPEFISFTSAEGGRHMPTAIGTSPGSPVVWDTLSGPVTFQVQERLGRLRPMEGSRFAAMTFAATAGVGALDIHLDLSAYSLANDNIEVEFSWLGSNYQSQHLRDQFGFLFLSVDGGASFLGAIYWLDPDLITSPDDVYSWQSVRVGMAPLLSVVGSDYTDSMILRFQVAGVLNTTHVAFDTINVFRPLTPEVGIRPVMPPVGMLVDPLEAGVDHQLLLTLEMSVWGGSPLDMESLILIKLGDLPDNEVSDLRLWQDDGNGLFDPMSDIPLASVTGGFTGAQLVFAGTPLTSMEAYDTHRFFISASIPATASHGRSLGLEVNAISSAHFNPNAFLVGDIPFSSRMRVISEKVRALPWHVDWEGDVPPANLYLHTQPNMYPSASTVGTGVTMEPVIQPGRAFRNSDLHGGTTYNGRRHLILAGTSPTEPAVAAADFHFDLSAFQPATDSLEFSLWMQPNYDGPAVNPAHNGVFLSDDGGVTWAYAAALPVQSNATPAPRVHFPVTVDLSQAFVAGGMNFTTDVVVRVQAYGTSYHILHVNDVRMTRVLSCLEVRAADTFASYQPLHPGAQSQPVGAFELIARGANQTLVDLNVRKTGNFADGDVSRVRVWVDANGDGFLHPAQDLELNPGTAVTFSGGEADFVGLNLNVAIGTPVRLFVTVDLAATAAGGQSLGIELTATDFALAGTDPVLGDLPLQSAPRRVFQTAQGVPSVQTFDGSAPANYRIITGPDNFLSSTGVGVAPTSVASGSRTMVFPAEFVPADPAAADVFPTLLPGKQAMRATTYGTPVTGGGIVGYDFHYDLSGVNAARDQVIFQFAIWTQNTTHSNSRGVFLSLDGGATWETTLMRMDSGLQQNQRVWNRESVDVSAALRALGKNYTNNVVIRVQGSAMLWNNHHWMISDVRLQYGVNVGVRFGAADMNFGGLFNLGSLLAVGAPNPLVWTIVNRGEKPLRLLGTGPVQVHSPGNATVTVSAQPAVTEIAPGGSADFTIEVTPAAAGAVSFTVDVYTNDTLKNPFSFNVVGQAGGPLMQLQRPAGVHIPHQGTDDLGTRPATTFPLTYRIANTGNSTLTLGGTPPLTFSNLNNCTVQLTTPPPSSVAAFSHADFTVSVTAQNGPFSFRMIFQINEPIRPVYEVIVQGLGVAAPAIAMEDGSGVPIAHDGFANAGIRRTGGTYSVHFAVVNEGTSDLHLLGTPPVEVMYSTNCTAVISLQPNTPVAPGEKEDFRVDITPTFAGPFAFRLRVTSNDVALSDFQFTVTGQAQDAKKTDGKSGCATGAGTTQAMLLVALLGLFSALRGRRSPRPARVE
jgi:hypothetical protein